MDLKRRMEILYWAEGKLEFIGSYLTEKKQGHWTEKMVRQRFIKSIRLHHLSFVCL